MTLTIHNRRTGDDWTFTCGCTADQPRESRYVWLTIGNSERFQPQYRNRMTLSCTVETFQRDCRAYYRYESQPDDL
jgi:hypothetical protein